MSDVDKIVKENDYVISNSEENKNDKVVVLKSSEEFLKWFLGDKSLHDKKIGFIFDDNGDVKKMEVLYNFLKYYLSVKDKFTLKMENYNDLFVKGYTNRFLEEALEQFVSSNKGGKFLRASLIALGYQSFGKDDDKYLPLGIALEIFQTSILIHDDIIDKADKRRGLDTIPVKYQKIYGDAIKDGDNFEDKRKDIGNSMALCLGDLGFYLALQIIVKNYRNNKNLDRVLEYYNDVAIKTCEGEMVDVILPFYEEFYGEEDDLESHVMEIYKFKTAWYSVVGPYCMGAILGGLEEDKVNKLEDALLGLGIAFQIKDDLLGIYGDEKHIGKSVTSDVSEYKQTILYAYAINTEYRDELLKYYGKDISVKEMDKVKEIFDKSGAREYANKTMDKLFKDSFKDILDLDFLDLDKKKLLLGFAEFLKVRSK